MPTINQRQNLRTLADYLAQLPKGYEHFDMAYYYLIREGCGTTACALGHAPSAGIITLENETWEEFSKRVFGIADDDRDIVAGEFTKDWEWLFSENWQYIDNTPHGAAARIFIYLYGGVPKEFIKAVGDRQYLRQLCDADFIGVVATYNAILNENGYGHLMVQPA